jgi:hypothetical protein
MKIKWFFLASFIAALFCSMFWTGVIIFSIATHRLAAMGIREWPFWPRSRSSSGEHERCSDLLGIPDVVSEFRVFAARNC